MKRLIIRISVLAVIILTGLSLLKNYTYNKLRSRLDAAIDIESPVTRAFSRKLAAKYPGEFNINQVCEIYDHIKGNWKYVNDPRGNDHFSKASESIENGFIGDCDDFAILIASSLEAIGGRTRINIAVNSDKGSGHAFTEVYLPNSSYQIRTEINQHYGNFFQRLFGINAVKEIHYVEEDSGIWLNLDWFSDYPGGPYYDYTSNRIFNSTY